MSNFQGKLNLLDAAWQTSVNTRRVLERLERTNPNHGVALSIAIQRLGGIEANLSSLRELIQEEKP